MSEKTTYVPPKVELLGKVNLKYKDEIIPDVEIGRFEKTFKGKTSVFYSTKAIPEIDVEAQYIRLYFNIPVEADFESIIKPLFEGEVVKLTDIPYKNKQGSYNASYQFFADEIPDFIKGDNPSFIGNIKTIWD